MSHVFFFERHTLLVENLHSREVNLGLSNKDSVLPVGLPIYVESSSALEALDLNAWVLLRSL